MDENILSAEEEPAASERMIEPTYAMNLIALIIAMVFCLFLFRII